MILDAKSAANANNVYTCLLQNMKTNYYINIFLSYIKLINTDIIYSFLFIHSYLLHKKSEISHHRKYLLFPKFEVTLDGSINNKWSTIAVWATTSKNVPSYLCTKRRIRSDCAQSDQNLHLAHFWRAKDTKFLLVGNEDSDKSVGCAGFESSLGIQVRWYVFWHFDSCDFQ